MLERKYEEERNEYRRLKEKFKKEAQNLSQMYLISKSWLEKWKKVSGYNKQKRNDKWKNNKDLSSNLGAIDNSVLLINTTECKPVFYKFKENEIFIENYNERKEESKYINKQIWEFFKCRYGSNPELPLIVGLEKNEEIKEIIKYIRIAVINLSNNNVQYEPQNFTRLVNTKTSFKEFKEGIKKYYFSKFISNNNTEISYWLLLNRIPITLTFIDKVQEVRESFKCSNIPDNLKSLDDLGLQNYFYDLP